jgi:hypothetical protein
MQCDEMRVAALESSVRVNDRASVAADAPLAPETLSAHVGGLIVSDDSRDGDHVVSRDAELRSDAALLTVSPSDFDDAPAAFGELDLVVAVPGTAPDDGCFEVFRNDA